MAVQRAVEAASEEDRPPSLSDGLSSRVIMPIEGIHLAVKGENSKPLHDIFGIAAVPSKIRIPSRRTSILSGLS